MSLIRIAYGEYVDPFTRERVTPPGITPRPTPPAEAAPVKTVPVSAILAYRTGRCQTRTGIPDADVFRAVREWQGNVNAASIQLAMTREGIRKRLETLEARGLLPEDIARMIAQRAKRRKPRVGR